MRKAADIEALIKSANDASGQTRNIWITFLLFGTYLAITVGAITHRDLLLESPVRLPLLNIDLSLFVFYGVAPFFFLVFHIYLFLQIYVLVGKLQILNANLARRHRRKADRRRVRQRVDAFPITQMLAGPVSNRLYSSLIQLIVLITVFLAPILLLSTIQVSFLAYHDPWLTWWHRVLLLLDLVLCWMMWLRLRRTPGVEQTPRGRRTLAAVSPLVLVLPVGLFSMLVATVPGEPVEAGLLDVGVLHADRACDAEPRTWQLLYPATWFKTVARWDPRALGSRSLPTPGSSGGSWGDDPEACVREPQAWKPTAILFESPVDHLHSRQGGWFARNLVAPALDPGDLPRNLRGRDLRFAFLVGADLRGADLRGSDLTGAMLNEADLSKARLDCVDRVQCVALKGASLRNARLDGADLAGAGMHGSHLDGASLAEASLHNANLAEASLSSADLRGANLSGADLDAARLDGAKLDGANLYETSLIGASLEGASLQGVLLGSTKLDAASLARADLSGAKVRTDLVGTDLTGTKLAGADLGVAQLSLTVLEPDADLDERFHLADLRSATFVRRSTILPEELP
ncbi:MAG: pentapeptide repeat-containing protein, partial [Pseudomonadota bacterium]